MNNHNETEKSVSPNRNYGDYQSIADPGASSNKWLVVTLAFIVMLIGGAALFSRKWNCSR